MPRVRYGHGLPGALWAFGVLGVCVTMACGTAQAQSVKSRIDQPTPATLPHGTHHTESPVSPDDQHTGRVAPPSAIKSSTDVIKGGSLQGGAGSGKVNPIEHLPKDMQR